MVLEWDLFEGFAGQVLSWLDTQYLGRMEAAFKGVDRKTTSPCWETLASMERNISSPWLLQCLTCSPEDATGKEALKKFLEIRARLTTVPAWWSPQITAVSPFCLHVVPNSLSPDAPLAEDTVAAPPIPPCAAVPLALGVTVGEEMSVGVEIQCKRGKHGRADEGVWFGLSFDDGGNRRVSVLCAPWSGRCMLQFPGEHKMFAQAMPPLTEDLSDSVELYVTISRSGDVEFVRVSQVANAIVRSGRMPRGIFPNWASTIFPAISVHIAEVSFETTVLTKWAVGGSLREDRNQPDFEFDASWSLPA